MKRALLVSLAGAGLLAAECGDWAAMMQRADELERAGRYEEAERSYLEALPCGAEAQQPYTLNALGMVEGELNHLAAAERHFRHALAIVEKMMGDNSPEYGLLLSNLAGVLLHEGRRAQAESLMREAITINVGNTPEGDLRAAIARSGLAELLLNERRYKEARELLDLAIPVFANSVQTRHLGVSLSNLAVIQRSEHHFEEEARTLERAVNLLEQSTSPGHPVMIRALNNLATAYYDGKRYEDSVRIFDRAIAVAQKAFGPDHPIMSSLFVNYATVLRKAGRKNDAKAYEARAEVVRREDEHRNGTGMTIDASAFRR